GQARPTVPVFTPWVLAGPVVRLTFDKAVNLAVRQNTAAQTAVLTAAQSEQDKRIALSQLLPQASLSLQEQRQRNNLEAQFGGNPANVFPVPPGSGAAFPRAVGPFNIFSTGVGLTGPLFDLTLYHR